MKKFKKGKVVEWSSQGKSGLDLLTEEQQTALWMNKAMFILGLLAVLCASVDNCIDFGPLGESPFIGVAVGLGITVAFLITNPPK